MSSMMLSLVDECVWERVILKLDHKKSYDTDGLSVCLLKRCYTHLLQQVTTLINKSFQDRVSISIEKSKFIPAFKKEGLLLPDN